MKASMPLGPNGMKCLLHREYRLMVLRSLTIAFHWCILQPAMVIVAANVPYSQASLFKNHRWAPKWAASVLRLKVIPGLQMGDGVLLPDGRLFLCNGAQMGEPSLVFIRAPPCRSAQWIQCLLHPCPTNAIADRHLPYCHILQRRKLPVHF